MGRFLLFGVIALIHGELRSIELAVSDYFWKPGLGLYFTRANVTEDIVYFIPPIQERFVSTGQFVEIDNEQYVLHEAIVGFIEQSEVNLDDVKNEKPEWEGFGFLRAEVTAEKHCAVSKPRSEEFFFFQSLDDVWKREGRVSTTEAIYCRVSIALRPESDVIEQMEKLAESNDLIDEGIAVFELIPSNGVSQEVELTDTFAFLLSMEGLGLDSVDFSGATASIGAALSHVSDDEFGVIKSKLERDSTFFDELVDMFYSRSDGSYALKNELIDNSLSIVNTIDISESF